MSSVAAHVLTSPDILRNIQSYQDGIFYDMLPFLAYDKPLNVVGCADVDATLHAALAAWYASFASSSRLHKLLDCLPHMSVLILRDAACAGNMDVLHALHDRFDLTTMVESVFCDVAARYGQLDVIFFCVKIQCLNRWSAFSAVTEAALHGHLDVVEFLVTTFPQPYPKAMGHVAAKIGHQWDRLERLLASQNAKAIATAIDSTAAVGDLDTLVRLGAYEAHLLDPLTTPTHAMDVAAANGHLGVLQWLHTHRPFGCTTDAMDHAAKHGHLAILQWLDLHRSEGCTMQALAMAAHEGHFETVQWLCANRRESMNPVVVVAAAGNGHLAILQYLVEGKCIPCGNEALVDAAKNGHLNVVKYLLHQEQSSLGTNPSTMTPPRRNAASRAMHIAAAGGHLEVVQFLHSKLVPCTTVAMDDAASRGHLNVVQWLHVHRNEGCTTNAMDGAAANGHLALVQWLHFHRPEGCTVGAMNGAATHGHLSVLKFLHTHRSEGFSHRAFDSAIAHGHTSVVRWLRTHDDNCRRRQDVGAIPYANVRMIACLLKVIPESFPSFAMTMAIQSGSVETVRLLHQHGFKFPPLLHPRDYCARPAMSRYIQVHHRCHIMPIESTRNQLLNATTRI
ncbi:Aste57867_13030 [Aphanomyces stellatus]|uniref:Aste57867_13030 protein n=1 Tax=Aphanomyces stellatus TaxID=120398 RepID=A0A485KXS6_9STRA|nr:hypothetical protein As57867_012982 [Aphanomyces stellatus]VFT89875.1 Aste57867_13030 [Aphanomyces stellatus]